MGGGREGRDLGGGGKLGGSDRSRGIGLDRGVGGQASGGDRGGGIGLDRGVGRQVGGGNRRRNFRLDRGICGKPSQGCLDRRKAIGRVASQVHGRLRGAVDFEDVRILDER